MDSISTSGTQGTAGVTTTDSRRLDVDTLVLSLTVARSLILEAVTRQQTDGMQEKNAEIRKLNDVAILARTVPMQGADTSDLMNVGKQMSQWGSSGGRSWMDPSFKDVLDKYGIQNKSTNMTKAQMSNASGGWYVSYPTDEYHALGQQVMAKAAELATPKADLTQTVPGSNPPQSYAAMFKEAGIPLPVDASGKEITSLNGDQMKAMVQNVQTKIDTASSNSQIDMIRTQGFVNKRNQAVETLTNLVAKFSKIFDDINSNMR